MGAFQFHAYTHKDPKNFCWFLKGVGKRPDGPRLPIGVGGGQVVLDSQLQNPWVCRVKMRLPFERSAEASCFLQATSVADSLLPVLIQLY